MTRRVLIFDSGLGGLSVSAHIASLLPNVQRIYAADDGFRPYGEKTDAQLLSRLPELLKVLEITVQPDLIVLACNTASTIALPAIRAVCDVPIIGVVPAIKPAAEISKARSIGVLGTPATVRRDYVGALIKDYASHCYIRLCGNIRLVEMAEDKLAGSGVDLAGLETQIAPLFEGSSPLPDVVVLACTHFPLLDEELSAVMPKGTRLVDSGEAIARRTQHVLQRLTSEKSANGHDDKMGLDNLALLVGGDDQNKRQAAFKSYGYRYIICLPDLTSGFNA